MTFVESVRTSLRKTFVYSGRASRPEYWWFALASCLAIEVVGLALRALGMGAPFRIDAAELALFLLLLVPGLSLTARRLHDVGRSGWWQAPALASTGLFFWAALSLIGAVGVQPVAAPDLTLPLVALATFFLLAALLIGWLVRPSQPAANRFGPAPAPGSRDRDREPAPRGPFAAVMAAYGDYLTFSGRSRRAEFWWFLLFLVLGSFVTGVLDRLLFGETFAEEDPAEAAAAAFERPLTLAFAIYSLPPLLALGWRRLHDAGRRGLWSLTAPALSLVTLAVVGLMAADATQAPATDLFWPGVAGLVLGIGALALAILVIVWLASRSQAGENRFGPEPALG